MPKWGKTILTGDESDLIFRKAPFQRLSIYMVPSPGSPNPPADKPETMKLKHLHNLCGLIAARIYEASTFEGIEQVQL